MQFRHWRINAPDVMSCPWSILMAEVEIGIADGIRENARALDGTGKSQR
jgi:hypothetical protein